MYILYFTYKHIKDNKSKNNNTKGTVTTKKSSWKSVFKAFSSLDSHNGELIPFKEKALDRLITSYIIKKIKLVKIKIKF